MRPNKKFQQQPKSFWGSVRSLSQEIGYTERGQGKLLVPSPERMSQAFVDLELDPANIVTEDGQTTELGKLLHEYFAFRAQVLLSHVEPRLMDAARAKKVFNDLTKEAAPRLPPSDEQTKRRHGRSGISDRHCQYAHRKEWRRDCM